MSAGQSEEAAHGRERSGPPPSAAGVLEPYGVRVVLHPVGEVSEAEPFLKALLEEVASRASAEGASVIGHLKCFLKSGSGRLGCSLTSLRSGAGCHSDGRGPVLLEDGAELALAVLVYGLPAATIDKLVSEALTGLLEPLGVTWAKKPAGA